VGCAYRSACLRHPPCKEDHMISTPTLTARRTPLRMVACIAATIALAGAASTALATPAWAHDGLVSSTPAAGEVVTEVSGLTLTCSEVLLDLGGGSNAFALRVSDVDENYYESGCITLDGST